MAITAVIRASSLPPPTRLNSSQTPCLPTRDVHAPCWRRRECFSAIASMVVSSSTVGFAWGGEERSSLAVNRASLEQSTGGGAPRWSDRRLCPQWHPNSLESIVPENLPRPADRLRSHEAAVDRAIPLIIARRSCFTM